MSDANSHEPEASSEEEILEQLSEMDIDQWLETLRRSDRSLYNMMALEVWSIAKTMDNLQPGFWTRFMANRQISLKQFMQQRKNQQQAAASDTELAADPEERSGTEPPQADSASEPPASD